VKKSAFLIVLLVAIALSSLLSIRAVGQWSEKNVGGVGEACVRDGSCIGELRCALQKGETDVYTCQPAWSIAR
jgi:hypothetical protein